MENNRQRTMNYVNFNTILYESEIESHHLQFLWF